jgi:hypothetical protein
MKVNKQQQREENQGEVLLTVAVVVFEVIASILEHIDALVLHLPAIATILGHRHHGRLVQDMICYPGVVV